MENISNYLNQLANYLSILNLSYSVYFSKAKLLCFSFFNRVTYLTSFLSAPIALAFTFFYFISLILIIPIVKWSRSTIFGGNLGENFSLIGELECLSPLLFAWLKFFNNCRTSRFCDVYSYMIEVSYFKSSGII